MDHPVCSKARSIIDEDARPLVVYLPAARAVLTLVERFDIEPFSDFSAK